MEQFLQSRCVSYACRCCIVVHGASRHEYVIQGQDANSFVYYSIIRSARVGFNFMAGGHGAPSDSTVSYYGDDSFIF